MRWRIHAIPVTLTVVFCTVSLDEAGVESPAPPRMEAGERVCYLEPQACQESVEALQDLLPHGLPDGLDLFAGDPTAHVRRSFDAMSLFSVLGHLSMQTGYVLDYVYDASRLSSFGSQPILYAREITRASYQSLAEYQRERPRERESSVRMVTNTEEADGDFVAQVIEPFYETMTTYQRTRQRWRAASYLGHVQTDGTPWGFFEMVLLDVMGSQFYLFWHALYHDDTVVCTPASLPAEETAEGSPTDYVAPIDVVQQAGLLDLRPRVEFKRDTVLISVVTFSKWRGFAREIYTVRRDFPHTVLSIEERILVPYCCGVRF